MSNENKPKVKIITIAVTYDPSFDDDPANWDWAALAGEWGNGPKNIQADIKIMTDAASNLLEAEADEDVWGDNAFVMQADANGDVTLDAAP